METDSCPNSDGFWAACKTKASIQRDKTTQIAWIKIIFKSNTKQTNKTKPGLQKYINTLTSVLGPKWGFKSFLEP